MSRSPRIPKAEITGVSGYVFKRLSKKLVGSVPEPAGVVWYHRRVLMDSARFGSKVEKWDRLDANLKSFAHMAVSATVGCSWCLDFQYFKTHNEGLDEAKASEVPRWRESLVFSPLEREVLGYAESVTATPPTVTDDQFASLLQQLGNEAMIELTAWVAFVNMATRTNVSLGIESQGFSDVCALPLARPSSAEAVPA